MPSPVSSLTPITPLSAMLVHARQQPQAPAARFLQADGSCCDLSRDALLRGARAAAGLLRETTAPGAVAAIQLPTGPGFVQALYGCFLAGVTALPWQPPARGHNAREAAILADARPEVAFTPAGFVCLNRPDLPTVPWEPSSESVPSLQAVDLSDEAFPDYDSPAYLQYSSGSVAQPRGVVVTHRQAAANVAGILNAFEISPADSLVTWLPLYHDMGLVGGILVPLTAGYSTVLMSATTFGRDPLSWLRAVARCGATVSGAPDFAYRLCAERAAQAVDEGLDLSRWELAFVGAETVRPSTLRRFARAFAPLGFRASALYPCYGLAEAVLMVSGGVRGAGWRTEEILGRTPDAPPREVTGCGRPLAGVEVLVADPVTRLPVPDGGEGEILVQGPTVAAGYWNREARAAQAFTVPVPERPDSCFLPTGDLGFLRGDELFVTGRQAGRLVIRGRNVAAEALEAAAETAHPALRGHVGVAFTVETSDADRLVVVHEAPRRLRREPDETRSASSAVRRALAGRWGVCPDDVLLTLQGAVPRTTSGKPIRDACRAAYLAGDLERFRLPTAQADGAPRRPADLPETAEERLLADLWERHLHLDDVLRSDDFMDRGGDSLTAALVAGDAARLGLPLEPRDLLRGTALADLADLIRRRRSLAATASAARMPAASRADWPPTAETQGACDREHGAERVPLTPNQRWFFLDPPAPEEAWRITAIVDTPAGLDPGLLREAWAALVARHQALRLFFPSGAGGRREARIAAPSQVASLEVAAPLTPQTPERLPGEGEAGYLDGICLATGPVAVARFHTAPRGTPGRLFLAVHHLVCDASSMHILGRDLAALCADLAAGGRGELPERSASYSAWVRSRESLRDSPTLAEECAFWKSQFREADERLVRPEPGADWQATTISLDQAASWALLQRSSAVYGTGAENILLAALAAATCFRAGQAAASVSVQRHGRHDVVGGLDLSATVGWLAYRHPLRIESPGLADPWHAAAAIVAARNRVPRDGAGYGLLFSAGTHPGLARLAAGHGCDAQFNFLGPRDVQRHLGNGWRVRASGLEWHPGNFRTSPVRLFASVREGRIHLVWRQPENEDPAGPQALHTALHTFLAPLMV